MPVFNPPAPNDSVVPAPAARGWLVVLPTGARVPVNGALLIGRNPVRFDRWSEAELLPVDDPARSVSKTHAVLEADGDGIRVTDLHSTNGVSVLDDSGSPTALTGGVATPVVAGATLLLGSYRLRIVQA